MGERNTKKVNLGIIGLGYIGQTHLRHSLTIEDAKVIATADVSKNALSKSAEMGVKKTYTSYEELLKNPEIDAVIIGLPTHLHLKSVRAAAEAKKHIFLEKPIARNVDEAKEIVSLAEKNSVKLMIGYPLRFQENFVGVKKLLEDESLGDIVVANATHVSSGPFFHRSSGYAPVPVPEWWFNKELTGGGALIDVGCHMINLLRWYFGDIKEIKCALGYRLNLDFEDRATCLIKFASGTFSVINVGWYSQTNKTTVELLGSVSHARIEHSPSHKIITALQMLVNGKSKFYEPHLNEIKHFIKCVGEDTLPSPSGIDGYKDLEAISMGYKNQIFNDLTQ